MHGLTELQLFCLKLTVEEKKTPVEIAKLRGYKGHRKVSKYAEVVKRTLLDTCKKFAVGTPQEAYEKAVEAGFLIPPE